jgi:Zn-dependent protease
MLDRVPFLLLFYPVLLFSLSCHEAAHGWMASRLGDPTAKHLGRITLNPLPHLDIIGTVIFPIVAILTGAPLIGWAKPVPVDPLNLKNPLKDDIWISAFGPISNVVLAAIFAVMGRLEIYLLGIFQPEISGIAATTASVLYTVCHMGVTLNLALALFNMIPIYPLDGGGVIRGLLPSRMLPAFDNMARYSVFILLILMTTGLLRFIFTPVEMLARVLLPM